MFVEFGGEGVELSEREFDLFLEGGLGCLHGSLGIFSGCIFRAELSKEFFASRGVFGGEVKGCSWADSVGLSGVGTGVGKRRCVGSLVVVVRVVC